MKIEHIICDHTQYKLNVIDAGNKMMAAIWSCDECVVSWLPGSDKPEVWEGFMFHTSLYPIGFRKTDYCPTIEEARAKFEKNYSKTGYALTWPPPIQPSPDAHTFEIVYPTL
jgi:hypothetical protein